MHINNIISKRTIDQLEEDIVTFAGRMNQAEYEFLVLIREFDLRHGWRAYHFNNCSEWIDMKCGISYDTAREKVRVAHALMDLPETSSAFSNGKLSYSKARALTRLATPQNEADLLEYALPATARQVENHCRELRNAQRKESTEDVNRIHKRRYLTRTYHNDGSMTINVEVTREVGDLIMKALECAMEQQINPKAQNAEEDEQENTEQSHDKEPPQQNESSLLARQADALAHIAQTYLSGGDNKPTTSASHYQVMVHVDEAALREQTTETTPSNAKSDLPIETVRRLCCDGGLVPITKDAKGNPLNVGRKHRVVQPALKRALLARDKCCRFPGCTHNKWLDAHHVMHWDDGGETSLSNTILLCSTHHRALHEGGFSIQKDYSGEWYFRNEKGRALIDTPEYRPKLVEGFEVREPGVGYFASRGAKLEYGSNQYLPAARYQERPFRYGFS